MKAVRRISAADKEKIMQLSRILYDFLPMDSWSKKAVTFTTIFAESKVKHYLINKGTKLQKIEQGFTKLIRYHKNLPKMIIRKIIPASIEYRNHKRNPIKRKELVMLSDILCDLKVDMFDEINKIKLDTPPPPVPIAPDELKTLVQILITEKSVI